MSATIRSAIGELGCQAVAYTTGVPAMIGAAMVLSGQWNKKGVYTTDEFDPRSLYADAE